VTRSHLMASKLNTPARGCRRVQAWYLAALLSTAGGCTRSGSTVDTQPQAAGSDPATPAASSLQDSAKPSPPPIPSPSTSSGEASPPKGVAGTALDEPAPVTALGTLTEQGRPPGYDVRALSRTSGWTSIAADGGLCTAAREDADLILRAIDENGEERWARSFATGFNGVAAGSGASCLAFGSFCGDLSLDGLTLTDTENPPAEVGSAVVDDESFRRGQPSCDAYVVQLDEAGDVSWVKAFSGYGRDEVTSAVVTDSEILLAGEFVTDLHADSAALTSSVGSVQRQGFLARMELNGAVTQLQEIPVPRSSVIVYYPTTGIAALGSNGYQLVLLAPDTLAELGSWDFSAEAGDIAFDATGNLYVAAQQGAASGGGFFGEVLDHQAAVAKLTPDGELAWLRVFDVDALRISMALRESAIALTGSFYSADFGFGPMPQQGSPDIYFAELDLDGQVRYAIALGGSESDFGLNVLATRSGWFATFYLEADVDLGTSSAQLTAGEHMLWLDAAQ
jgi:hypothetical protein